MIDNLGLEEIKVRAKENRGVLIFSPHPDDSVFMAGTIWQLTQSQIPVYVCLVTAGQAGYLTSNSEVDERIKETIQECEITGTRLKFLRDYLNAEISEEDASLVDGKTDSENNYFLNATISVIRTIEPGVIFLPSEHEKHKDHINTNKVVKYASWRAGRLYQEVLGTPCHYPSCGKLYEYEITSLMPEKSLIYVDITGDPWQIKLEALSSHLSQINRDKSYINFIDLFNSLRGQELYGSKQVEDLLQLRNITISGVDVTRLVLQAFRDNNPKAECFKPISL